LKIKYDEPLSKFAFNFSLRRYKQDVHDRAMMYARLLHHDPAAAGPHLSTFTPLI
jgi:hypothetical protein